MTRSLALLWAAAALWPGPAAPQTDPCAERGLSTSLGQKIVKEYRLDAQTPTQRVKQLEAAYLRIRLQVERAESCPWRLVLRDRNLRVIQALSAAELPAGESLWSERVPGDTAVLDLVRCRDGAAPAIVSREQIWMPKFVDNKFYSTKTANQPDWVPLYSPTVTPGDARLGDSVGMLVATGVARLDTWACSGAAIAADLFLTNWHCISGLPDRTPASLQNLFIDMSWDEDALSRDYQVVSVEAFSKKLDFAILRVRPLPGSGPLVAAPLAAGAPAAGPVRVVHHPEALPKRLSFRGCGITALEHPSPGAPYVAHTCDTEAGSSGAPLFDSSGAIVGLHYCGFTAAERVNRAVRTDRILAWLRDCPAEEGALCNPALHARVLAGR